MGRLGLLKLSKDVLGGMNDGIRSSPDDSDGVVRERGRKKMMAAKEFLMAIEKQK